MSGKIAVRNVRLCEKDCLCLYVCPTGASDTENSVIDADKCIGCGACAEACPARAISLVPREYPPQQVKDREVITALRQLASSKAEQEELSSALPGRLAEALERSNRIMAEDLLREDWITKTYGQYRSDDQSDRMNGAPDAVRQAKEASLDESTDAMFESAYRNGDDILDTESDRAEAVLHEDRDLGSHEPETQEER